MPLEPKKAANKYTAIMERDVVDYPIFRERLPTNQTRCIWIPKTTILIFFPVPCII